MDNPKALKHFYNQKLLQTMANEISTVYPNFNRSEFLSIDSSLLNLEMKDRVRLIRDQLKKTLPNSYPESLKILMETLKGNKLSGFGLWPYTEYVQTYGLDHVNISLSALKKLTVFFTSEWAVRPFIKKDLEKTLSFLKKCIHDQNHHVRRWVSEGSRPRLPWGERLHIFIENPEITTFLVEPLIFDPELYVRKSVANHLNDISKDNPHFVVEVLKKWKLKTRTKEEKEKIDWIIKHALRSLIKSGDPAALNLIGVSKKINLKLNKFKIIKKEVRIGEKLDFEFEIASDSTKSQSLVIDYLIHFVKQNGTTKPKVFKLKKIKLNPKEKILIKKSHPLKPITTRKYYSGKHFVEIQVNGQKLAKSIWTLLVN